MSSPQRQTLQDCLIQVENLSKIYSLDTSGSTGTSVNSQVLFDVNLVIPRGQFVAIMGHSGSGKSTLMNMLGCLDTPTSGHYWLDGRDIASLSDDELARVRNHNIGFVFQGFNLLKRMSALDNVATPLLYAGVSRAESRKRALSLLDQTGLARFATYQPNQLSGGQQQRVAICRALINNPPLILADEPTGNLDTQTSREIMTIFQTLNREHGITVVLVTHEDDVAAYTQRLVRLQDGRIVHDEIRAA
ncbi:MULTISPECIES: ABC transporter ATP-binding protein [unclassified Nitrosospira]|uniref:ABC transporter ATP-binding protein n=1 Tax=unclassified Nitrosospira TaxID=2609267 RepID=UPI000D30BEA4|nr:MULTISPECIES: ABC transporter ATP-binding protein [unclassified Nitrosospira]PTR15157.1 putative ABC transport system ATP-binding protein [Nitrosospira sp. Nsp2]WON72668.1 ABC transporter ATP-binding protein [Nitrosospira sp. Is2]